MRLRRLLPALAAAAALALAATAATAPAQAQPATVVGCDVDYTISGQWATGYFSEVTVTNTGNVDVVWQVEIDFVRSDVVNAWNGVFTIGAQNVIVDPPTWAPVLLPGQVSPIAGFTGNGDGMPSTVSVTCTA